MINNVVSFPQLPDASPGSNQVKPAPEVQPVADATASQSASKQDDKSDLGKDKERDQGPPPEYTLRLTVDKDPRTGEWVYKAIDRYTGQVVRQMPRQELLDMKHSSTYETGSFIKTDV